MTNQEAEKGIAKQSKLHHVYQIRLLYFSLRSRRLEVVGERR